MTVWAVTSDGLRFDDRGTSIAIAGDFARGGSGAPIGVPVDSATSGSAATLSLPFGPVAVERRGRPPVTDLPAEARFRFTDAGGTVTVRAPNGHSVSVGVDGPGHIRRDSAGYPRITLDDRQPVTVGVRQLETPRTIDVAPTPTGIADAVTRSARRHPTDGVDRSLAARRGVPPVFRMVETDGAMTDRRPAVSAGDRTGVRVRVPRTLDSIVAAAPLTFYLGATLEPIDETTPHLQLPDRHYEFEDAIDHCQALLERSVWLDALVREHGGPDSIGETALLARGGLDPSELRSHSPGERLQRYLDCDFERIKPELPEWHLVTYLDPTAENLRGLPGLLDRLSRIAPPIAHELTGRELMERTLDDFYRASGRPAPDPDREARTPVDLVDPELRPGCLHAWLADGAPLDVYKAVAEVYREPGVRDRGDPQIEVTVVRNEEAMAGEDVDAAGTYRDHPLTTVRIEEDLDREALADAILDGPDLLHFVGHCDAAGLRCLDGHLGAEDLDDCPTRSLFLNACGSYHEGLEFVSQGASAVGVTYRKVLDAQARTVGTSFARLFVSGFPMEIAVQAARRRIAMGKDYAVVGDGTHTLPPQESALPVLLEVVNEGGESYTVSCRRPGVPGIAGTFRPSHDPDRHLRGATVRRTFETEELLELLRSVDCPIQYEDGLTWSAEFVDRLTSGG